jgi:colanic acid biosynthesis glycosyl transferase WcaI
VRILIYGINFHPEIVGIGKYTGEMARWLTEQGHDVRIVTAPPYYPAWRVSKKYSAYWYQTEQHEGQHVIRCPLWVPKKQSGLKRIVHLCSFAASSLPCVLWQGLFWRPDIVLSVAPAFFCAPAAWLSARLGASHASLHIQDFEIDAAFALGLLSGRWVRSLVSRVERWVLRRFDSVSTISKRMLSVLSEKKVPHARQLFFQNWVDTDSVKPLDGERPFRAELGLAKDDVVALYSGSMGEKQGLDILIDSAKQLSDYPQIKFVLCGDGAARERLQAAAQGCSNIRFLPLQPLEKYNDLLNAADIHLLPQRPDAADLVMPSKLGAILAAGGALIACASPGTEIADVVLDAGGVLSPPDDCAALARNILELANGAERRQSMRQTARDYALKHLNRELVLKNWFDKLTERVARPGTLSPTLVPAGETLPHQWPDSDKQ